MALSLLDEHGLAAVTIRSVGARLGAAPMSLYTYFASKQHLLELMSEEVASRLYADAGHPTWQAELTALCMRVRSLVLMHPNWRVLFSRAEAPVLVPMRERLLEMMRADGVPPARAFACGQHAWVLSLGFALVELSFRGSTGHSSLLARFERIYERCRTPEFAAAQPLTAEACRGAPENLDRNFEEAVQLFIAGIEATRA